MDSFPWLEGKFLDYKLRHSIPKSRAYSSLCEESNSLIDFVTPIGFSFRFDTSPSDSLSKSISLRLPSRAFGIGFIHQSPDVAGVDDLKQIRNFFFGPYFMYGKVSSGEGGSIEAYYSQKISSRGHFSLSSLFENFYGAQNLRNSSSSQSRAHLQWDFGRFALASSYCTFGKILGLQFLLNSNSTKMIQEPAAISSSVPEEYENRFNLGGEVYYTAQEGSGGISLGLRLIRELKGGKDGFNSLPVIFTLTGNPLMGHYRSTLTSPFMSPRVSVSTRFDVNINSFDSDLAAGVAYTDESPLSQSIRCAVGLKNGFTFAIQTRVTEAIKIRFGLKTGPLLGFKMASDKTSTGGAFGLDVAICN